MDLPMVAVATSEAPTGSRPVGAARPLRTLTMVALPAPALPPPTKYAVRPTAPPPASCRATGSLPTTRERPPGAISTIASTEASPASSPPIASVRPSGSAATAGSCTAAGSEPTGCVTTASGAAAAGCVALAPGTALRVVVPLADGVPLLPPHPASSRTTAIPARRTVASCAGPSEGRLNAVTHPADPRWPAGRALGGWRRRRRAPPRERPPSPRPGNPTAPTASPAADRSSTRMRRGGGGEHQGRGRWRTCGAAESDRGDAAVAGGFGEPGPRDGE